MVSKAVSFCMILAFSAAASKVWGAQAANPVSYITVSAQDPSGSRDFFADREWRQFFSVTPIREEHKRKEVQQLDQQFFGIKPTITKRVLLQDDFVKEPSKSKEETAKAESDNGQQNAEITNNKDGRDESGKYYTEPKYEFKYGVDDPHTGDKKYQLERRVGEKVTGEYALMQPNGKILTVRYKSDGHSGFYAIVDRGDKDNYGW